MRVQLTIIIVVNLFPPASAFCLGLRGNNTKSLSLNLVTEDDVITLVEKSEKLWAQVEKLRIEAQQLSIQAESLGQEAEISTSDAMNSLKGSIISADKIEMASNAQNVSIDLGSLLEQVQEATERADAMEVLADEALAASQAAFDQYLIDFPEAN